MALRAGFRGFILGPQLAHGTPRKGWAECRRCHTGLPATAVDPADGRAAARASKRYTGRFCYGAFCCGLLAMLSRTFLLALVAFSCIALSLTYSFSPLTPATTSSYCLRTLDRFSARSVKMSGAAGTLEKPESRGHILLRKYHEAKGLTLPRLTDEEEALFPKDVPEEVAAPGASAF